MMILKLLLKENFDVDPPCNTDEDQSNFSENELNKSELQNCMIIIIILHDQNFHDENLILKLYNKNQNRDRQNFLQSTNVLIYLIFPTLTLLTTLLRLSLNNRIPL